MLGHSHGRLPGALPRCRAGAARRGHLRGGASGTGRTIISIWSASKSFLFFGEDPAAAAEQAEKLSGGAAPLLFRPRGARRDRRPQRGQCAGAARDDRLGRRRQHARPALQIHPGSRPSARSPPPGMTRGPTCSPSTGRSDIVALFDEAHRLIAEMANHYRPGIARYVEIRRPGKRIDSSPTGGALPAASFSPQAGGRARRLEWCRTAPRARRLVDSRVDPRGRPGEAVSQGRQTPAPHTILRYSGKPARCAAMIMQ